MRRLRGLGCRAPGDPHRAHVDGLVKADDGPTMPHDADEFTMILDTSNIWVIKEFVKKKRGLHIFSKV